MGPSSARIAPTAPTAANAATRSVRTIRNGALSDTIPTGKANLWSALTVGMRSKAPMAIPTRTTISRLTLRRGIAKASRFCCDPCLTPTVSCPMFPLSPDNVPGVRRMPNENEFEPVGNSTCMLIMFGPRLRLKIYPEGGAAQQAYIPGQGWVDADDEEWGLDLSAVPALLSALSALQPHWQAPAP